MATKKLLITGFDPFNNQSINPSWQSVKELADQIGDYQVTKLQIPTVFDKAVECVLNKAKEIEPDAIICVGLAGGRSCVTPEVVAINLIDATIPDNEGNQPQNTPILFLYYIILSYLPHKINLISLIPILKVSISRNQKA